MSIKCGKCKRHHESVQEVKLCHGVSANAAPATSAPAASREFVKGTEEDGPAKYRRLAELLPNLKRAHYAVERDGVLKFYQVDKPTEGRWVGYTFIKVQASDEFYPVRNMTERIFIIEAIAEDPQAAMLRYGKEIGSCGHCHRTLTNEESRQYGIGPICRSKMGW